MNKAMFLNNHSPLCISSKEPLIDIKALDMVQQRLENRSASVTGKLASYWRGTKSRRLREDNNCNQPEDCSTINNMHNASTGSA